METVVMAPVFSGTLHPIRPGVLGGQFDKEVLEPGQRYEIRIPNTMMTKAAKKAFNEEAVACQIVSIPLGRAECPVHVKWEWPPNTWYSHKPLPLEVHYALWNRTTNKEVDRGVLRNRGARRGTVEDQMRDALRKITALLAKDSVQFQAATDQLTDIAQAWSVIYVGDPERTKKNSDVLDKIAKYLTEYPDIGLQVHGRTGDAREAPEKLARHFGKRSREDVVELCEDLAKARAKSCITALIQRGVDAERLLPKSGGDRTGYVQTDFIPMPKDDIDGKRAAETKKLEESVTKAKAQFDQFLRQNQIVFNAAREAETKRSDSGIKQSWSIDHLNLNIRTVSYTHLTLPTILLV